MEFNFNINHYFKNEITKIGSRLIPDAFTGDRREIQECISRVSHVLTVLGENSAKAQGLQKVITSGEKLRNTEHVVYVLTDPQGGKRKTGLVLGMLKMGFKHLYVFDLMGNNHEVSARCVLDFYVHESKQRMGLGKKLFQYMLQHENIEPQHLAIDKPSPKFLSFLRKHYGLESIIPQMNNFVVFNGFFNDRNTEQIPDDLEKSYAAGLSSSARNHQSGRISGFTTPILSPQAEQTAAVHVNQPVNFGRPAPHRPVSTVGLILQHKPPANNPQTFQPASDSDVKGNENNSETVAVEAAEPVAENLSEDIAAENEVSASPAEDETPETALPEVAPEISPTPAKPITSVESSPITPPLRCKAQASKTPHLDLKFYHSSLW